MRGMQLRLGDLGRMRDLNGTHLRSPWLVHALPVGRFHCAHSRCGVREAERGPSAGRSRRGARPEVGRIVAELPQSEALEEEIELGLQSTAEGGIW